MFTFSVIKNQSLNAYALILICLFFLSSCNPKESQTVIAKKGVLDLRDMELNTLNSSELNGELWFYPDQFIDPGHICKTKASEKVLMEVPLSWSEQKPDRKNIALYGYGSYHLKILINNDKQSYLKIFSYKMISSASVFYINGEKIAYNGKIGKDKETSLPSYNFISKPFKPNKDTLNLVVHVSNFHYYIGSGIIWPLYIGENGNIEKMRITKLLIDVFILGSIFIIAIYHFAIFLLRKKNKSPLYLSLACLCLFLYILRSSNINSFIFPNNFQLDYVISNVGYYMVLPAFILFFHSLFPKEFSKYILYIMVVFGIAAFVIHFTITPAISLYYRISILIIIPYVFYVLILAIIRKRQNAIAFLVGLLIIALSAINDILLYMDIIHTVDLIPAGILGFILTQAYIISHRFSHAFEQAEVFSKEVSYVNENLEKIVYERTKTIENHKNVLAEQHKKISKQNKEIKSSINYASKIQKAAIPSEKHFASTFKEFFVISKPCEIVSGDFLWLKEITMNDETIHALAVVDCTGHGVPGAFVSMLGISMLNEASRRKDLAHPDEILELLRSQVKSAFHQTGKESEQKDGFDIGLCFINPKRKTLEYAGAYIPLTLIKKGDKGVEFIEIKANRNPIGIHLNEEPFQRHSIHMEEGDTFYMYTDGFIDLMNENSRKFLKKRVKELLLSIQTYTLNDQKMLVEKKLSEWKGSMTQVDDITIIGFKM